MTIHFNILTATTKMNSIFRVGKLQRYQNTFTKYYCSTSSNIFIPIEYKDTTNNETDTNLLKEIIMRVMEERDENVQLSNVTLSFTPISGGITNKLFKCMIETMNENEDDKVSTSWTIRVYGGEGMIDREIENETFIAMSNAKVGKEYIGNFENGRVESWIDNAEALTLDEMSNENVYSKVAVELAKLHKIVMPKKLQDHYGEPSLWPQLWSWLEQAQNSVNSIEQKWGEEVAKRFHQVHTNYLGTSDCSVGNWDLKRVERELITLDKEIPDNFSPPVFAHNDLLAGNILLNKDTGEVHLIDFEYGGTNYRGFDIANHWNEWAGGTQEEMNGKCEYERFPTNTDQLNFCKAYLNEKNNVLNTSNDEALELVHEANKFVLLNHWFWGLWAVNQVVLEGTDDFDYIKYAESRAEQYWRHRMQ
jgi:ethanolamine kinase